MGVSIQQGLRKILQTFNDVKSISITDQEGVTVVYAGEPMRDMPTLSNSFATALDQSNKLNLGAPKYWTFNYDKLQMVVFCRRPFIVYIAAEPEANNSALCSLFESHLSPILDECEIVNRQVLSGLTV